MTELDNEFQNYLHNVRSIAVAVPVNPSALVLQISCQSVIKLPYSMRCTMARQVLDCIDLIYYFDYLKIMYCILNIHEKWVETVTMCIFVTLIISYLILMSTVVDLL